MSAALQPGTFDVVDVPHGVTSTGAKRAVDLAAAAARIEQTLDRDVFAIVLGPTGHFRCFVARKAVQS